MQQDNMVKGFTPCLAWNKCLVNVNFMTMRNMPVAEARLSACDNESDSDGIHHGELVV